MLLMRYVMMGTNRMEMDAHPPVKFNLGGSVL